MIEDVKIELILNVLHYQNLCSEEILNRAELMKFEDVLFHKDIDLEFTKVIKSKILKDLNNKFGIEEILIAIEDLEYHKILC